MSLGFIEFHSAADTARFKKGEPVFVAADKIVYFTALRRGARLFMEDSESIHVTEAVDEVKDKIGAAFANMAGLQRRALP